MATRPGSRDPGPAIARDLASRGVPRPGPCVTSACATRLPSPMPLELLVILIVLGALVLVGAVIVVVRRQRALPPAPEHKPLAPGAEPRAVEGPVEFPRAVLS